MSRFTLLNICIFYYITVYNIFLAQHYFEFNDSVRSVSLNFLCLFFRFCSFRIAFRFSICALFCFFSSRSGSFPSFIHRFLRFIFLLSSKSESVSWTFASLRVTLTYLENTNHLNKHVSFSIPPPTFLPAIRLD